MYQVMNKKVATLKVESKNNHTYIWPGPINSKIRGILNVGGPTNKGGK